MNAAGPPADSPPGTEAGRSGPYSILHLTAASDAGGVSRYLFNLCTALHDRGHRVITAGGRGAWHHLFDGAPWPWIDAPLAGGVLGMGRALRLLRADERCRGIDVVHAHYRKASIVGRRLAGSVGCPLLFTLHLTGIPLTGLWRWLSDFGDHTHAPSQEARRWLLDAAGVDRNHVSVIPHGIDPRAFPMADGQEQHAAREVLGIPADAPVAAFVGRFDDPKNVGWMLDLAAAARTTLPELTVMLMGEGPQEARLRGRIASQQLGKRVLVVPYGDPLLVYRAADALLLPSSLEGFSLVCTEAMSVGRAVLRTLTAGTSEHVVEDVTGRSVPIDRDAFVRAALAFMADREALARMGRAAAGHVRAHLTFDRQLDETLAMYGRVIAAGRGEAGRF